MNGEMLQQALRAHQAGDLEKAAELYRSVLASGAKNFDALYLLGFLLCQKGQWEEAEKLLSEAVQLNPLSLDGLYNHGRALERLGRSAEALRSFDRALAIRADIPEILHQRGNALLDISRASDALASYDRAVALKPDFAEAWNNRGNALANLGRLDEALSSYDRILSLRPYDIGARNHRALTLFELRRYEEAAEEFSIVLQQAPAIPFGLGNQTYCKLNACDWDGLAEACSAISAKLEMGVEIVTPIHLAALSSSAEELWRASRIWGSSKYPKSPKAVWNGEIYRHEKIRVAYLSADFHSHATAALMAGVFENHNNGEFETLAISYGPDDGSFMRRRLQSAFSRFLDVRERSDAEIAAIIREAEIDIAVDLKGYTQDARSGILSHRPAPVQAQYLGFPGTMGVDYVDYLIADGIVVPWEHEQFYSEKIVRLPDTYQCNDSKRLIADAAPARNEEGLPEEGFVFCCFNNNFKIQPDMFSVWLRLLAAIEGSVLWLLEDNAPAARNLRREAESRGIAAGRLIFAPRVSLDLHLARHRLADLFLDTTPYNAHTSASDSLWAGLPVLTCKGTSFAGRVGASLLQAAGLPELITESHAEYEALALCLARDPAKLSAARAKLLEDRNSCALFDTVRFTRHLETAFRTMWERSQRGETPASFDVPFPPKSRVSPPVPPS